jgi:membrane associated rhomboid family serine protease
VFPLKDNIPTERTPYVTIALIALNVVVYFLLQKGGFELTSDTSGDWSVKEYAAVPCTLSGECSNPSGHEAQLLTLFTAMFMHGSILHLGGNMLFLWIFGNNVEDAMGPVKFIVFYLLGGVAAMALQTAVDPDSSIATLGASGAVAAIIGGYILLHPKARVVTLIFIVFFVTIVQIPAILFLGFWFLQQVAFGYFDLVSPNTDGGGVAYFAHIGGFVFGLALIKAFASRRRPREQPLF